MRKNYCVLESSYLEFGSPEPHEVSFLNKFFFSKSVMGLMSAEKC